MSSIFTSDKPLTVEAVIRRAAAFLESQNLVYGHGTAAPMDDASWLVLEAAGLSPLEAPDYTAVYPADRIEKLENWLRQRAEDRMPVAYLVGRIWFAGIEFKADSRALVPRSPIAEFILEDFYGLVDVEHPFSVLDMCTGGGSIALATASHHATARVTGTDISEDALSLARENRARLKLDERVEFVQGDLFAAVNGRYDLILSNPPYVDAEDMAALPSEFKHEPELGLASGYDGLDFVRRLLAECVDYLEPGGLLVCEVGNSAVHLVEAFPEVPFVWLEFERGGTGIFAIKREVLVEYFSSL